MTWAAFFIFFQSLYNQYKQLIRYHFKIKMAKDSLETKVKKSVRRIDKNVSGIYNILTDLSLKLTHIISSLGDYYNGNYPNYYTGS